MRTRLTHFSALAAAAIFVTATATFAADESTLGNQNYQKGNFAAAKVHYLKAIAAAPDRWDVHYQLANTCLQLKDKEGAKKSYIRCLSLNPTAEIRTHCERAVGYLAGLPLAPTPTPAPVTAPTPIPKVQEQIPSYLSPSEAAPAKTDAEIQKEATRERIMREAEAEIVKMKEEENSRYRDIVSQSNRIFKSDGTYRRGLTSDEMAQFLKEVAAKEQAIRDRAKRNCDAIR
jgi:tetratricopeptide (TPR) repeat protein